ncbi:hypothetical protein SNEBB_001358 [Seison nebaliae]|nr:hypothetical protein SNEBB_001358 [Seison nebaliae]
MSEDKFFRSSYSQEIEIVDISIHKGQIISNGMLITIVRLLNESYVEQLKSNISGIIQKVNVKKGDRLQPGDVLFIYNECGHEMKFNNLCGICGVDLSIVKQNENNEAFLNGNKHSGHAMVHSQPNLIFKTSAAKKIAQNDRNRLIDKRKLILLIDLDQTILHTTTDHRMENRNDLFHFELSTGIKYRTQHKKKINNREVCRMVNTQLKIKYHTKYREKLHYFLDELYDLYEFHVTTYGKRDYAKAVISQIEKDRQYFGDRILTRDEFLHKRFKTGNLESLFPDGHDLVCIIDDRYDVWEGINNLIPVKPFVYFRNEGDINAPPANGEVEEKNKETKSKEECNYGCEDDERDGNYLLTLLSILKKVHEEFWKRWDLKNDSTRKRKISDDYSKNAKFIRNNSNIRDICLEDKIDQEISSDDKIDQEICSNQDKVDGKICQEEKNDQDICSEKKIDGQSCSKEKVDGKVKNGNVNDENEEVEEDDDDIVEEDTDEVEWVTDDEKDENVELSCDLRDIIPYVKKKTFNDVRIQFSGIIPWNHPDPSSFIWVRQAKSVGADVVLRQRFSSDNPLLPTHLVYKNITKTVEKCFEYNKSSTTTSVIRPIKIVHCNWFVQSFIEWKHMDEDPFELKSMEMLKIKEQKDNSKETPKLNDGDNEQVLSTTILTKQGTDVEEIVDEEIMNNDKDVNEEELREVDEIIAASDKFKVQDKSKLAEMLKELNDLDDDDDDDDDDEIE